MSSREGAGWTEQMVIGLLGRAVLPRNAKAAEMVVFPTPPLPKTRESLVPRTGQRILLSRIFACERDVVVLTRNSLLPAKMCSPKRARLAVPITGAPEASPTYKG